MNALLLFLNCKNMTLHAVFNAYTTKIEKVVIPTSLVRWEVPVLNTQCAAA